MDWIKNPKIISLVIALTIANVLIYCLTARPMIEHRQRLYAERNKLYQQHNKQNIKAKKLKFITQQLNIFNKKYRNKVMALLRPTNIHDLITSLIKLINYQGLTLHSATPLQIKKVGLFKVQPILLKLTGTYSSIIKFITILINEPCLAWLRDFKLQATAPSNTTITMMATLEVYHE